jgi:signal transduction histidine kinase
MTPGERGSRAQRRARAGNGTRGTDVVRLLEARVKALEDQNAVLEAEKAALEAYAALAAHELVTPLVIAESYASIVGERLTGPEHEASRTDLQALARSASRARLLVESLLHDARASRRPLMRRPVDLDAVVRQIVAGLDADVAERQARVEISTLPVVVGDEPLLSSVFTNLIVNALKYSPRHAGSIAITAVREPHDWRFVIRSGGPPIAAEDRSRIFELYNRGRGERRERGLGLGLAISRRIVERHGGTIGVTADDSGNEFFFTIPAR